MIAYLKGIIVEVTESRLILDVNDIGYLIYISGRDAANMPGRGEEVKIHTYLNVKEDAIQLFGFLSGDVSAAFECQWHWAEGRAWRIVGADAG